MRKFTPIAMRCNQKQFNEIEPKLKDLSKNVSGIFSKKMYLINNLCNELFVKNVSHLIINKDRKVYETWNESVFLNACGIEYETKNNIKMKKVILENEKEEVYLSDLNDDSIVGILWIDKVKTGCFTCNNKLSTIRNDFANINLLNENIVDYINTIKVPEVYQFDTMKELFKWLSED